MIAVLWTIAGAAVAGAVAALVLRSRRSATLVPLADAGSLTGAVRRTWLRWAIVAGALVALLLAFVLQSRATIGEPPLVRAGADVVVVIDLSGSTRNASPAIARTLLRLTRDGSRHIGLVLFSDTAYEALPPSSPVDGLKGWLELFANDAPKHYPWTPSFSSGTAISTGLALARQMFDRDQVQDRHVVLVSDLIDAAPDLQRLQAVVAQYQREGIDLRIVQVNKERGEQSLGAFSYPNATFAEQAASLTVDPEHVTGGNGVLIVLLVLVGLLGLLAAAYELVFHPLTWRPAR